MCFTRRRKRRRKNILAPLFHSFVFPHCCLADVKDSFLFLKTKGKKKIWISPIIDNVECVYIFRLVFLFVCRDHFICISYIMSFPPIIIQYSTHRIILSIKKKKLFLKNINFSVAMMQIVSPCFHTQNTFPTSLQIFDALCIHEKKADFFFSIITDGCFCVLCACLYIFQRDEAKSPEE